jgi:hypothetical protein
MKLQADLILVLVEATAGAIGLFIAGFLLIQITGIAPFLFGPSNPVGQQATAAGTQAINILDSLVILIFIVGVFVAAISASYVNTNAAFAFIGVIVLPIIIVVAVVMHNIFFDFTQSTVFGGVYAAADTVILFTYYPIFALIGWFVIMIFTYGKPGSAAASGASSGGYGSPYGG